MIKKSRYHDFILFTDGAIRDSKNLLKSYTVRVFESPAGEGEVAELVEIPDYNALNRKRRQLDKRLLSIDEQIEFGVRLFELLLPSSAKDLFTRSLAELGPGEGLRLRLRLLDELAIFPWEYMCIVHDQQRKNISNFLCLDRRISIVRHEQMAIAPQKIPPSESRQVFIAMASPKPYREYKLLKSLPNEQRLITEAIINFDSAQFGVHSLPIYENIEDLQSKVGASLVNIQQEMIKLDHVDIFHFSGHGVFREDLSQSFGKFKGTGSIILADKNNIGVPCPGEKLAEVLKEQGIRLVVLGACETGTTDIFNAWTSVTAKLLQGRIPSVIAMQFGILDEYAAVFMAAVYEALVDGRTIDEAVFQGRIAIRARSTSEGHEVRDWGTPVLYSRVEIEHIFPPIKDDSLRLKAQQSIETRSNLYQSWWNWMDHGATVSKSQLRFFSTHVDSLEMSPVQILILLRSAVVEGESVEPWLSLTRKHCTELIEKLDDPRIDSNQSIQTERGILSLDEIPIQQQPKGIGQVAWTAVAHPSQDPFIRQTAALVLCALPEVPTEGLSRIDKALEQLKSQWRRFAHKIELRGSLADHDSQITYYNSLLLPWERFGIWLWRVWKRIRRDNERIRKLVYGSILGAGFSLGILHGIIGFIAGPSSRIRFAINLFYGGILGAGIGLSHGLAPAFDLDQHEKQKNKLKTDIRTILLGTVLFGFAHIFVSWFNNLIINERPIIILTGTIAGLGLNIALFRINKRKRINALEWLIRLVTASIPAILAQMIIILIGEEWAATSVTRTGLHLQDAFGKYPQIYEFVGHYLNSFSYLFAALVNCLMTLGIILGWQVIGMFNFGEEDENFG